VRRDTDKGEKERDGRNGEREERRKDKTVQVKNGDELFWLEQKRTKNCWKLFLGKKNPIVKIAFPRSVFLFHCSIQNNVGGDETTFAFAVTHHQHSSQG